MKINKFGKIFDCILFHKSAWIQEMYLCWCPGSKHYFSTRLYKICHGIYILRWPFECHCLKQNVQRTTGTLSRPWFVMGYEVPMNFDDLENRSSKYNRVLALPKVNLNVQYECCTAVWKLQAVAWTRVIRTEGGTDVTGDDNIIGADEPRVIIPDTTKHKHKNIIYCPKIHLQINPT